VKALSIRTPWWWYILHAGKDIENRDWPTRVRGRVLIHASKWWVKEDIARDDWDAEEMAAKAGSNFLLPDWRKIRECCECRGCIVGSVEIVDCVPQSDSPWFVGDYGFVLRNPVTFAKPIPYKGALGFFGVPDDLVRPK
jgi:hypothetical protein